MINDLIDSGILETLDDMKKVIKFFEWWIETKDKGMEALHSDEEIEAIFEEVKDEEE